MSRRGERKGGKKTVNNVQTVAFSVAVNGKISTAMRSGFTICVRKGTNLAKQELWSIILRKQTPKKQQWMDPYGVERTDLTDWEWRQRSPSTWTLHKVSPLRYAAGCYITAKWSISVIWRPVQLRVMVDIGHLAGHVLGRLHSGQRQLGVWQIMTIKTQYFGMIK